jgi:hypothetical protein
MKNITQKDIIMEYFKLNPYRDIHHPEIVDWAMNEYNLRTGKVFRDPDRMIRQLSQAGFLIKVNKGVYRYEPDNVQERALHDFTAKQKKEILKRDGFKCVLCGRGKKEGVELHIDHIKPKEYGGKATIENGQVLCSQHNFIKKTMNQTETGKKMFIRLYELAKAENNPQIVQFCAEILEVYEKNGINGHIIWNR